MNATEQYVHDRDEQVRKNLTDRDLEIDVHRLTESLVKTNYVKNYTWMGIPILQYPTDLMVMQELIWDIKPDVIVEFGVAFGGMTMFYASMLESIEGCGCPMSKVLGVDIEIRRASMEKLLYAHPLSHRVELIEGSSVDIATKDKVTNFLKGIRAKSILVSLDSNHTSDHVLEELRLYSPLVQVGSYTVVFDTAIEFYGHLDKNQNRPWGKGNNPWGAVQEFMKDNDEFIVDKEVEKRALITSAPGGFLRRIK